MEAHLEQEDEGGKWGKRSRRWGGRGVKGEEEEDEVERGKVKYDFEIENGRRSMLKYSFLEFSRTETYLLYSNGGQ